jgi:hypothetical protein
MTELNTRRYETKMGSKVVTECVGLEEVSKITVREAPMVKKKIKIVLLHLQLKNLLFM